MHEWNSKQENIVASIADQCSGYQWMLNKTTRRNQFIYRFLGLSAIPFSILSGTGYFTDDVLTTKTLIFGIFGIISAILLSMEQFLNFQDHNQQYMSLANKFQEINNEISYIMALDGDQRPGATEFIPTIMQKFDLICDTRPVLGEWVVRAYRKHLQKKGISVQIPDIIGAVTPLVVNNPNTEAASAPVSLGEGESSVNIELPIITEEQLNLERLKKKSERYQMSRTKWLWKSKK